MKKKIMIGIAAIFLVAILSGNVLGQQFIDSLSIGLGNVWMKFESFLQGGYSAYQLVIDFTVFFLFFMAATLIGLKQWMGEQNRQVTALSIVIGLMMALALVWGAKMSLVSVWPFAKGLLFVVLVIVIYSLLLKMGMDKHKFLAFLLAAILTGLFFLLAGWFPNVLQPNSLFGGGSSGGGGLGSIFGGSSGGSSSGKTPAATKLCNNSWTKAFTKNSVDFVSPAGFDDFMLKCTSKAKITVYASWDEDAREKLTFDRGMQIKNYLFSKEIKDVTVSGAGGTWKFQSIPLEDQKAIESGKGNPANFDSALYFNRAIEAECECKEKSMLDKITEGPKTCSELMGIDIRGYVVKIVSAVGGSKTKQVDKGKIEELRKNLEICKQEALKSGDAEDIKRYNEASLKFHTEIGTIFFDVGSNRIPMEGGDQGYALAKTEFELIDSDTNGAMKEPALDNYYSLILKEFKEDFMVLKDRMGGTGRDMKVNKVNKLKEFRDLIDSAITAQNNLQFWTYRKIKV